MSAKRGTITKHYRLDPNQPPRLSAAQARRLDEAKIDYSEIPPLPKLFFEKRVKKQLTIRVDADVVDWLKQQGPGYQTRINQILRLVMERQR